MGGLMGLLEAGGGWAWVTAILGVAGGLACAGLVVVAIRKGTRGASRLAANICFFVVLLVTASAWLGQRSAHAAVDVAGASVGAEQVTASLMERYAVGTWNILLGVLAGLIPLLSGAALLVRAGMTAESRPADRAAARRWPGWIAAGCLVAGAGLGAWALCSFLVFDQFRLGLVVCFF